MAKVSIDRAARRLAMTVAGLFAMVVPAASQTVSYADLSREQIFTKYNLVVIENLDNSSQDIEGATLVGGNLKGGAPTVSKNLDKKAYAKTDTIVVGGNVDVGNLNLQAGNLRYGGTLKGKVNLNGGGASAQGVLADASIQTLGTTLGSALTAVSDELAQLKANSVATLEPREKKVLTFDASPVDGLAVFSINASDLTSSNRELKLNRFGAESIVINVLGDFASNQKINASFENGFKTEFGKTKVLWNFVDATNIQLNKNFLGAILAPRAHLKNTTAIDGSVFVKSFDQRGEVHLPNYSGFLPKPIPVVEAVPEPSTMLMFGLGVPAALAVGRLARRRSA